MFNLKRTFAKFYIEPCGNILRHFLQRGIARFSLYLELQRVVKEHSEMQKQLSVPD